MDKNAYRSGIVRIRPEAQDKLHAGFQRKVDRQRRLYAAQLAEAEQLASSVECGAVVGIFSSKAADDRAQRRRSHPSWLYAFTGGFMIVDGPRPDTVPVLWSQVTGVREVWTTVTFADWEPSRPTLTAHELSLAGGQTRVISQTYRNMLDPYPSLGRELRDRTPPAVAAAWPRFPLIAEVIATYAERPVPPGFPDG
jgi:hypothetical protein